MSSFCGLPRSRDRREYLNIIRAAFDHGVTFFDTAEAYGPHECERILGEAIVPFRDKVAITSKFGWNIDLETGERRPGLISRRDLGEARKVHPAPDACQFLLSPAS